MNNEIDSYRIKFIKVSGLVILLTPALVMAALYIIKIDDNPVVYFLIKYYLHKT